MRRPLLGLAAAFGLGCLADRRRGRPARGPGAPRASARRCSLALALARRAAGAGRPRGRRPSRWARAAAEVEGLRLRVGGAAAGGSRGRGRSAGPARVAGRRAGRRASSATGACVLSIDAEAVEVGRTARARLGAGRASRSAARRRSRACSTATGWRSGRRCGPRPGRGREAGRRGVGLLQVGAPPRASRPGDAGPLRTIAAACARRAAGAPDRRSMPPGPERGLVLAMVLGDRSELDEATAEAFRASGTYHVLALSGAQVALVAGLIVGGAAPAAGRPVDSRPSVTSAAVWLYALLVGGDVPIVRAALMASARARRAGRSTSTPTPRTCSGWRRSSCSPCGRRRAADVGFQLSFGATLGHPRPRGSAGPRRAAAAAARGPGGRGLAWRRRPPSRRCSRPAVPPPRARRPAAQPRGGAALRGGPAVGLRGARGRVPRSARGAAGRRRGVGRGPRLRVSGDLGPSGPWLDVRVPRRRSWSSALHVAGLVLLLPRPPGAGPRPPGREPPRRSSPGRSPGPADGRLHLTVLDVGQGDSLLLRSPSGRAILVDAGGSWDPRFDAGERRVAPELWRLGVRRLDALVVTHAHPDHVGGAPFLLRAFRVAQVWEGPAPLGEPGLAARSTARLAAPGAARRGRGAGRAPGLGRGADPRSWGRRAPHGRPGGCGTRTRWCSTWLSARCASCSPATSQGEAEARAARVPRRWW